jgi:glycosyltransferase involved in cell wall biosynthesis
VNAAANGLVWEFKSNTIVEEAYLKIRDQLRTIEFNRLAETYKLFDFDIYHFHGGIDFFRDSRWVKKLSAMGKPIICHYHGPDIRSRGIIRDIDRLSSLNLTNEFDLLSLRPGLRYLPIPFDCSHLPDATEKGERLRIIHTPSNPEAKGTHLIEPVMKRVMQERNVECVVLTGCSHQRILEEKSRSHIAIEQIGNFGGTGYGVNSLETLAMNMPTLTEFTPEYARFVTDHPFVLVNKDTIYDALIRLIDNKEYRENIGGLGRAWVVNNHSYASVWKTMLEYMETVIPTTAKRLRGEDL